MFRGCICFCVANSKRGPQESLTPCLAVSTVSLDNCGRACLQAVGLQKHAATHPRAGAHAERLAHIQRKVLKKEKEGESGGRERRREKKERRSCTGGDLPEYKD